MKQSIEERFWSKVKREDPFKCLEWTAAKRSGYGAFWTGVYMAPAHRVSWEWKHGPFPDGFELHHICENRACVDPAHLKLVTRKEHFAIDRSGDRHHSRINPEAMARGERHGTRTHPERIARGDRSSHRLHPELYIGERNGAAKLSCEQVLEIREWRSKGWSLKHLAYAHLVSFSTIGRIVRRDRWTHI